LTSLMTGEDWETHGIIGHSWKVTENLGVNAFAYDGQCKVPNIADLISHSSQGSARTLVVSGSIKMASAMAVHKELVKDHPDWNNRVLVFSPRLGITSLYSEELVANIKTIRAAAQQRMMQLQTSEGFVLAAELYAIDNFANFVKQMPANVESESCDFLAIGITSIKTLSSKYGRNSEQVSVALRLIDNALANMYEQLDTMYDSRLVTQVIGLGSSTSEHTAKTHFAQMRRYNAVLDDYTYPYNTTGTFSQDDVTAFQTTLWVAVGLIIAAIIGILYIVKMDMLYDSLLYKTTDGPRAIPDVR